MTAITSDTVLLVFLAFCRIGGCLMLMPGFSSTRVPVNVRLFIAVAVTLALSPVILPVLQTALPQLPTPTVVALVISETVIGALIGVMGRMFFLALQFMATAAAMYIGLGSMPGSPIEDTEPLPAFAALITLTATLLFFLTDQHWEVLRALLASYSALPVTEPFAIDFSLAKLTDATSSAFILALQISSPVHRLHPDHQSHGRHRQQARAADSDLLHLDAHRARGRVLPALFHDRRGAARVHDGLHGLAGARLTRMGAQASKIHRILAVQEQMHRIEEWKLADLRVRLEQLATDQKDLIGALNEDNALQGLFIDSMARRLQALSEEASKTEEQTDVQAARLLEQAGRLICAERLAGAADLQELRDGEKKDLAEVDREAVRTRRTSLRQDCWVIVRRASATRGTPWPTPLRTSFWASPWRPIRTNTARPSSGCSA